jgi:hypothetical protein
LFVNGGRETHTCQGPHSCGASRGRREALAAANRRTATLPTWFSPWRLAPQTPTEQPGQLVGGVDLGGDAPPQAQQTDSILVAAEQRAAAAEAGRRAAEEARLDAENRAAEAELRAAAAESSLAQATSVAEAASPCAELVALSAEPHQPADEEAGEDDPKIGWTTQGAVSCFTTTGSTRARCCRGHPFSRRCVAAEAHRRRSLRSSSRSCGPRCLRWGRRC